MVSAEEKPTLRKEGQEAAGTRSLPVIVPDRDMQHFTQVAVHDIKAPVRKIKVFANLLRDKSGGLTPALGGYLQKIESATRHRAP